jgi:hypothetical protein
MKKTSWMTAGALATLIVSLGTSTVQAQAPGPVLPVLGAPSTVSLGLFIPSGSDAKTKGGASQFQANFTYGLPLIGSLGPLSHTVIGLGIETGSKGGAHSTVIPLTVSQLFGVNGQSPTASGSFYYGVGAGLYFLNQSNISVATRIGAQLQGGYNITSVLFADAKYQFVDHADGFLFSIGGRF